MGRLGGSVGEVPDFSPGHDPALRGFESQVGLCADSSEPGACFRSCVSLSLCLSPACTLSPQNKQTLKKMFYDGDDWVAQLVEGPTSAQVMIS